MYSAQNRSYKSITTVFAPRALTIFALFLGSFCFHEAHGQFGFCGGNTGDPIFQETFGSGTTNGPALPAGTTSYSYVPSSPEDGSYTISSTTNYHGWHNTTDHTPGDTNGKAFIVNASFTPGEFFRQTVSGLCENTSYEFSSWLLNLLPPSGCGGNGIPINVKFEIWDLTDAQLLASGNTGPIFGTNSPQWDQYGLVFQTLPGQTSVILKMINNGAGGCGNDLAIDDITFRSCGDNISLTSEEATNVNQVSLCEDETPITVTLSAEADFSVYSTHAYQWQESTDSQNWADIPGETNERYTSPPLNDSMFYRVKLAEDNINLSNPKCNTVSDVFEVVVVDKPDQPLSNGNVEFCSYDTGGVSVTTPDGVHVDWYDAPSNGTLLASDTPYFETTTSGTYYAEAVSNSAGCPSTQRTEVTITYFDPPEVTDETLILCEGKSTILNANVAGASYVWSTGETSSFIIVDEPGTYTVIITNPQGCSSTKTMTVSQIDRPIIAKVLLDHRDFTIVTANSGEFEYSIDSFTYQDSPVFSNMRGGIYVVYVREKNGCGIDTFLFNFLVIPRFFTPNGDLKNDVFRVEGSVFLNVFEISIFDRTSKLLMQSTDRSFSWDGQFNGNSLPASDYWYVIKANDKLYKGHFALKR